MYTAIRKMLVLLLTSLSMPIAAQTQAPACREFIAIQNYIRNVDGATLAQVLPGHDWEENVYARRDFMMNASNVGKTLVLALIGRASWVGYAFVPSRAEAATVTGSYIRSPDHFARFLQLTPQRACSVLRIPGREGDTLRELTHELWVLVNNAQRR